MSRSLTEGNPTKLLISFTLPMLLGSVFQQFYNMVDTIVVGKYVGPDALAAVGSTFSMMFFVIAIISGLSMGISVIIAQYFGAKKLTEMRKAFATALLFTGMFALILTVAVLLLIRPVLTLLGSPEETYEMSSTYLWIVMSGLIFNFGYNVFASILRAVGDSKTPLYFLILSTTLNVFLDLWFVLSFGMGVAGVAWATLISQAISAILCVAYTFIRKPELRLHRSDFTFDLHMLRMMLDFGVPTALQQALVSMGMMAVQGLVNSYGFQFMAGYAAAGKIDSFAMMPIMSFGLAMSSYTGQNIGAGKLDRIKQGLASTLKMSVGLSAATSVVILLTSGALLQLFVDAKETFILSVGMQYLAVVSLSYVLMAIMHTFLGLLRGAGDVGFTMISSLTVILIRVPLAYLFAGIPAIGASGIWYSIPISWSISCLLLFFRYRTGKWKNKSVMARTKSQAALEME